MDPFRLDGLTALVTGAGTGIGAALARALGAAGADVACHGNKHTASDTAGDRGRAHR
jgi:2-deoxy-D-gluconate 3-dehydrogenase